MTRFAQSHLQLPCDFRHVNVAARETEIRPHPHPAPVPLSAAYWVYGLYVLDMCVVNGPPLFGRAIAHSRAQ